MWQHLHGWSSLQPFQNFIRFSTRQLLTFFVNTAGALFERIVSFKNIVWMAATIGGVSVGTPTER